MAITLTFPDSAELSLIEQNLLPTLTQDDIIFKLFPIVNKDATHVIWSQKDDFRGLMQARGINGQPTGVTMLGANRYQMEPGRYSEFVKLDERDIEGRRPLNSWEGFVSVDDLVMDAQVFLLARRIARIKWILWTLLTTGRFAVPGPDGGILHKDEFPLQTATSSVPWATAATAVPLKDFRALKLLYRGSSARFDATATAFMNLKTFNDLLNNANANDIAGKRIENGATFNSKADYDRILLANDLPGIVVYDDGYKNDAGTFVTWIPDGKVVVVGSRTSGATIGEFQMTRNVINPNNAPGPYTLVYDSASNPNANPVPRVVRVDDGFNGGPAIYFASAIIILTVT